MIGWFLSQLDLLPWIVSGILGAVTIFFKFMAGKHKADAKAANKRLETIDKVERITRDAEEISDGDLAKSLLKRR